MKIGDRVEAGWVSADPSSRRYQWAPPRGEIIAVDGPMFRVRWKNGYEAKFSASELRLQHQKQAERAPVTR